jgi:hypothetical protein
MAGFCELAIGLKTPNFSEFRPESSKVSGRMPEYSRFRETADPLVINVRNELYGPS